MKIYNQPVELIIETASSSKSFSTVHVKKELNNAGITTEEVHEPKVKSKSTASATLGKKGNVYVKTAIKDAEMNPWDVAHTTAKTLGKNAGFIEPDLPQEFVIDRNVDTPYKKGYNVGATSKGAGNGFDPDWQPKRNTIWHLDDKHSGLKSAREAVADIEYDIRIGHLDTGYSKVHPVIPDKIKNNNLQRNFIAGELANDAHDPNTSGLLRMPGHGTGTLGILAGGKVRLNTDDGVFNDYLGGAPTAEVICCRIAPSVILMKTSAFAEALHYLTELTLNGTPVHVVSMSMGGAPAKAWVSAVNKAYDAGITIVTAAGNNYNGLPTRHVIYPARFKRVIAACGVTYDFNPYFILKIDELQGCFGPERHMQKALAAFTPNTPWATVSNGKGIISFSGAGTSSATPQIAAAAANYYKKYHQQLDALLPWQRVEAIRNALYTKALKKVDGLKGSFKKYFGNGILQANASLSVPVATNLKMTEEDEMPWFPILTTIFKAKPKTVGNRMEMFNTELAQLVYYYPDLALIIDNEEKAYEKVSKKKWKQFTDAVIAHPASSITLKQYLMSTHTP